MQKMAVDSMPAGKSSEKRTAPLRGGLWCFSTEKTLSAGGRGHAGEGFEMGQALAFGQGRQAEEDPLHA